jgi:hypothetical protein
VDQRPGYKRDAIKAMLRFHLIPVRMLIFKNRNNICWQGWVERGTLIHWLVGMQISITIMEGSVEIPQKAKNRAAI